MKKWRLTTVTALTVVALVLWAAGNASASAVYTFDENGNGSVYVVSPYDGSYTVPMAWEITSPPSPYPGHATLCYYLVASVAMGDVVLIEPEDGTVSDILRFIGNRLFVYSDNSDGADELADTGIPDVLTSPGPPHTAVMPPVYVPEVGAEGGWNGISYIPVSDQPGYYEYSEFTYNFTSDIPEPATMSLLTLGGLSLIGHRRKRT